MMMVEVGPSATPCLFAQAANSKIYTISTHGLAPTHGPSEISLIKATLSPSKIPLLFLSILVQGFYAYQ